MADAALIAAFQKIEILKELSQESHEALSIFAIIRPVRVGETLFCKNEPSPYCFGILSGEVILTEVPPTPSRPLVYREGMLLEGMSLLREVPRPGLASVSQTGSIVSIWSSRFRKWLELQSQTGGPPRILAELQDRLR